MGRPFVQRYMKKCRRCGDLFGPGTAYVMNLRAFCSPECNAAIPRGARTLEIEEMGATGMGPRAISRALGGAITHQRVSTILTRKRRNP